MDHYLDDFIAILPAADATPARLAEYDTHYKTVTDLLWIPRQESKDQMGTVVPVFGIQVDTNLFVASLHAEKITKAIAATSAALFQTSLSLREAQLLTG